MANDSSITYFDELPTIIENDIVEDENYFYINRPNEAAITDIDNIISIEEIYNSFYNLRVAPVLEYMQLSNWTVIQRDSNFYQRIDANGLFVMNVNNAGSTANRVFRSEDAGASWANVGSLTSTQQWFGIYAGSTSGVWVICSIDGTSRIRRTVDNGLNWTTPTGDVTGEWVAVANNEGTYWVVVGNQDISISSDDGSTWLGRTPSNSNTELRAVSSSKNPSDDVWIAVGNNSVDENAFMRSIDNGLTWTDIELPAGFGNDTWRSIDCDGNGTWVAVAGSGSGKRSMISTDNGVTFTELTTIPTLLVNSFEEVRYQNNRWTIVSADGEKLIVSSDLIDWTAYYLPYDYPISSMVYTEGVYIAVTPTITSTINRFFRSLVYKETV